MEEQFTWSGRETRSESERLAVLQRSAADLDLVALGSSLQTRRLLAPPFLAVLDTSFFYSAFASWLRYGGAPLSLQVARQGGVRLFIADETLIEVFRKLDEFADSLGTTASELEEVLIADWSSAITVVDVAGVAPDGGAGLVAQRDPTDRPAAVLASLLSPCLLLTTDKDFEPLGIPNPTSPVLAVKATIVVNGAIVHVQAMVMIPTLPVAGLVQGVRWLGSRAGVSPWIIAAVLIMGGAVLYQRMHPERRVTLGHLLGDVGMRYLEEATKAWAEQQRALQALEHIVVPPARPRPVETVVLRELARADEPLSAQRLWARLDAATRPAVASVRAVLRSHPAASPVGRGVWTFGLNFDELLELGEESA